MICLGIYLFWGRIFRHPALEDEDGYDQGSADWQVTGGAVDVILDKAEGARSVRVGETLERAIPHSVEGALHIFIFLGD